MIISASRRTDIPAKKSEWLIKVIREGFCEVRNPFNPNQISRVSLNPADVELLLFWTKNGLPLMKYFDEIKEKYKTAFLYTINNYPETLEPNLPPLAERIGNFRLLSRKIGPNCLILRYDPILISEITNYAFHKQNFSKIAGMVKGFTKRIIISATDQYSGFKRRIKERNLKVDFDAEKTREFKDLLKFMAETAALNNLEIVSCCEEFNDSGIRPAGCIDIKHFFSSEENKIGYKKDKNQRKGCLCTESKDIGTYNTCTTGCIYCYATR